MLYLIAEQLGFPGVFNLIRYISFRAGGASATALLIGLLLGPMRELGSHSDELHAGLAPAVLDAKVDCLILIGDEMRPLAEKVVGKLALDLASDVAEATDMLRRSLRPGDAVLVKASNSVGLAKLVESMTKEMACST